MVLEKPTETKYTISTLLDIQHYMVVDNIPPKYVKYYWFYYDEFLKGFYN